MIHLPNTVLNFHEIHDEKWIDRVFALLKKHYTIVSIDDIENFYYNQNYLKNACHITFDDGDISFYDKVFPLLKKHDISVSIYVSPLMSIRRKNFWFQEIDGYDEAVMMRIMKKNSFLKLSRYHSTPLEAAIKCLKLREIWKVIDQYQQETGTLKKPCLNMTAEQLREVHKSGFVAVGAHTQNHPILRNESDEIAEYEINTSIVELGNILNSEVRYFAYPNGMPGLDFGEREKKILYKAGIKLSFSMEKKSFNRSYCPLAIPRDGFIRKNHNLIMIKLISGSLWRWNFVKNLLKYKEEEDYRIELLRRFIV